MVLDSPLSDDVADQLSDPANDAPPALAINASLEDFEIQFGPVTGLEGEDQDSTLPWNPQDLNIMQVYCRTKTFYCASKHIHVIIDLFHDLLVPTA